MPRDDGATASAAPAAAAPAAAAANDTVDPEVALWEEYVGFLLDKPTIVGSPAAAASVAVVEACDAAHKAGAASAAVYSIWIDSMLEEVQADKGKVYASALAVAAVATAAASSS